MPHEIPILRSLYPHPIATDGGTMRYAELFAGAGGLSLGLERAGFECAWHAEIADAPRAILAYRWPDTPLYGDVTTLDGRELTARHGPIDLLSGGSPCQDLSVAGKRAGMTEGSGTRSSLFFEQMRLWQESGADLCLWENVDGARSSNSGKDFAAVLRAFVGAAVAVPSDGWRGAGVAAGPGGVAAWRVLDAQYFGVPQRRRRVFVLGTRTGRVDPAEVLSLAESVRGDTPTRREAGEGFTRRADAGVAVPILEPGKRTGVSTTDIRVGSGIGDDGDPMFTLQAGAQHGVIAFGQKNSAAQGDSVSAKCTPTLDKSKVPAVLSFDWQKGNDVNNPRPSTLNVREDRTDPLRVGTVPAVCITGETTHSLTHEGHDASEDGTGRGTPIVALPLVPGDHAGSYNGMDAAPIADAIMRAEGRGVAASIRHKTHPTSRAGEEEVFVSHGVPRRLTPRECERLMGWPDDHTLVPDAKGKLLSDAARYKAAGNGVASVHSHWIGWRLRLALEAQP